MALCSYSTHAQNFLLTFEDTAVINQVFYTDSTIDPQGVWQIGAPQKSFMDSAFTQPYALVTSLDSFLPVNTNASFIITLPGYIGNFSGGGLLTFTHKFSFDSAHGGGYIEFSIDTGRHWHGIFPADSVNCENSFQRNTIVDGQYIVPPMWRDSLHRYTLPGGINYYTGTDSTWINDSISFPTFYFGKTTQLTQYMFRFTAFTDSISASSAGWLIDNIRFSQFGIYCGGGINEINSSHLKVFPDPVTDAFDISILNEHESDYTVIVYDLAGRPVIRQSFSGQELIINRGEVASGSYFIQVLDTKTQNAFQKRIVFD